MFDGHVIAEGSPYLARKINGDKPEAHAAREADDDLTANHVHLLQAVYMRAIATRGSRVTTEQATREEVGNRDDARHLAGAITT